MSGGRWAIPRHERPLTDSERAVLRAFQDLLTERPYPPTIRDVAKRRGVTVNAVRERLEGLLAKGYLDKYPKRARSLRLTERGEKVATEDQLTLAKAELKALREETSLLRKEIVQLQKILTEAGVTL